MATVTAFIRTSKRRADRVNIRFRLRDGRDIQLFHTSEIEVNPNLWDSSRQEIKAKVVFDATERLHINRSVATRKNMIMEIYNETTSKEDLTSERLDIEVDKRLYPEKYQLYDQPQTFFETFDEFLTKHKLSEVRKKNFRVVGRALQRYELYKCKSTRTFFELNLDIITADTLRDIEDFMKNEHIICKKHPDIYKEIPENRTPQPRGQNTINDILTKIRTFCLWAINEGKTTNNPFKKFSIEECVYGTPYYITIEEKIGFLAPTYHVILNWLSKEIFLCFSA